MLLKATRVMSDRQPIALIVHDEVGTGGRMGNLPVYHLKYEKEAPDLSKWMLDNLHEGFTFFNFPVNHWVKIRTSNVVERLNREIKRRTSVVGIFPNVASCERLISAVLLETSEEWQTGGVYLSIS